MAEKIPNVRGWVLICREEIHERRTGGWHIAWDTPFGTKKSALAFAKANNWTPPYRAVRGALCVHPQ